jgi:uncharacterized radical SAM superfamily Fe-S cluster-containing enzyme
MSTQEHENTTKYYYDTTTLCPTCEQLLPGQVSWLGDGVYVTRTCPEHGYFRGLICSDRDWFERLPQFDVTPVKPARYRNPAKDGCPRDCGLCPAHRQMAGTAAIEISNHCNSDCPVCLADNNGTFELSPDEVQGMVAKLLDSQEYVDVVALSGGEPTIHPRIFEIIDKLETMNIGRILINTNGWRIAADDRFLDELAKRRKVYVSLHADGSRCEDIRGVAPAVQEQALERLIARKISVVPLVLAVQGVNDFELGVIATNLLTRSPEVKTIIFSMMTHAGRNGSRFAGDPERRLTIPGALDCIEQGSAGRFKKRDFMPLPMPNPLCAAIGYFLVEGDEITPIIPLAGVDKVVAFLGNTHFGNPDAAFERFFRETIDDLYANADRIDGAAELLAKLRRLLERLFPVGERLSDDERRRIAEESIKAVYLMQFMDSWAFDSVRTSKCSCQHLLPDGVIIPSCGYYSYHRRFDSRFA